MLVALNQVKKDLAIDQDIPRLFRYLDQIKIPIDEVMVLEKVQSKLAPYNYVFMLY
jgi:hypothetical protein